MLLRLIAGEAYLLVVISVNEVLLLPWPANIVVYMAPICRVGIIVLRDYIEDCPLAADERALHPPEAAH